MIYTTLSRDDMRAARREIMAVQDPAAQAALFTILGLLQKVSEQADNARSNVDGTLAALTEHCNGAGKHQS